MVWTRSRRDVRERADAFGRVPYVPDFDVSSGNSEDEAGGVPETRKMMKPTERQEQGRQHRLLLGSPD